MITTCRDKEDGKIQGETGRDRKKSKVARRRNYSVLLLVGVAEDEESTGLRHGNGFFLQLNVGKWPRPRAHWHLWLILIIVP